MIKFLLYLLKVFGWKETTKESKIEIIKEVEKEVIKEVEKIVEKEIEVIKEVVVEKSVIEIQEKIVKEIEKVFVYIEKEPEKIVTEEDTWNNKWQQSPIVYCGRILKNEDNDVNGIGYNYWQLAIDVRQFILENDAVMKYIVDTYGLRKDTYDETVLAIQNFVINGEINGVYAGGDWKVHDQPTDGVAADFFKGKRKLLRYSYDDENFQTTEFWQFPFETIMQNVGDCEDGALLIASLAINAGVPAYRIKVAVGNVSNFEYLRSQGKDVQLNPNLNPKYIGTDIRDISEGGHAYCIYLASDNNWRVIDWCYYQDAAVPVLQKPLAKNGGFGGCYLDTWFTFNSQHSWAQKSLEVAGRLSALDEAEDLEATNL
jgi:hypothetical protein